jgi:UDP-N-acetylglucosamine 2-epimerase (non-hydrolysing)
LKVIHVVGARPNFVKIAPVITALNKFKNDLNQILVHTGQHYDQNMSGIFFKDLSINQANDYLGIGAGTHAEQTSAVMVGCEQMFKKYNPDLVVVVGDVNSTLAAAVTAAKMGIKLAHVESGLRSYDRSMPEEHNRVVTDHLSDILFTPSEDASINLDREGIAKHRVHFVGNVMIDSLMNELPNRPELNEIEIPGLKSLKNESYALLTLHRPSNVDNPGVIYEILRALKPLSDEMPVIFPIHPRTRNRLGNIYTKYLTICEPLGYREFLSLESQARLVLTDSGGIQEETTFLGVPCITIRENTERPITLTHGTNILANPKNLPGIIRDILSNSHYDKPTKIKYWDGKAAKRIADIIVSREWMN